MSRHRGKDCMVFQHQKKLNTNLRKERSSHRPVRIYFGFGSVTGRAVPSTSTKSSVSLFCFPRTCLGSMLV